MVLSSVGTLLQVIKLLCLSFVVIQLLSHVWLWPHQLQHVSLPYPSLPPGVCSNSCPLSWWHHPTISSSVTPFSSCLNLSQHQGLSNESVLRITWPKYWSFSFSISPSNGYSGLISFRIDCPLLSKGLMRVFSSTTVQKHQFFSAQPSFWNNSHILTWLLEKTIALIIQIFVGKVISLVFSNIV